jgi:transposase
MSEKERARLEVMQQIKEKRLPQREAAKKLKISERHVRRILRSYRQSGAAGLVSKRRGKPSNNQMKAEVKQQALDLIYSKYYDFGPTLAHEKLTEDHGLGLSRETVRQLMITDWETWCSWMVHHTNGLKSGVRRVPCWYMWMMQQVD